MNQIDEIISNEPETTPTEIVTAFENSSTFVEEPLENILIAEVP